MAGEALQVFEGDALFEQIGDGGNAEGVRREVFRQPGIFEPPVHHAADIVHIDMHARELLFLPVSTR